jgi:predicted nicotinamide N-methyase
VTTHEAADDTGAYAWPGGTRLARELPALADCRGLAVCDLGCGQGALAAAALAAGAAEVLCLDGSWEALAQARSRLATATTPAPAARFLRHCWGERLPVACGTFPLVLGGDILYRPECHPQLLRTLADLLAAHGQALLSDPRSQLEDELPALARAVGLDWAGERRAGFTLVRLRWLPACGPAPGQAAARTADSDILNP